ncbi:MAG: hypothetical protein KF856_04460 [Cyclobacteriaceae bacterium]|jgi:hypothetical protein|nr:hypothetical protein [Cyclobacteriaceae bacterium]
MKLKIILYITLFSISASVLAQEADTVLVPKTDKPERDAFGSPWLIDNPTGMISSKNTLVFDIQHRFGVIESGNKDLLGIWGPSNIRLGLSYAITDRITLGFGTTKNDRLQDFNLRVGLLRQTRSGRVPVSLTFYGNTAIDARESDFFPKSSNRLSYFSQLIVMRRFSRTVSLQVAPSFSHYNIVDESLSNNQFAIALGGKVSISDKTAILFDYSQPLDQNSDNPGLAIGIEMSTSSHAFQVFVGNYNGIVPQKNYMLNPNKLSEKQFLIGFNINRLWNF